VVHLRAHLGILRKDGTSCTNSFAIDKGSLTRAVLSHSLRWRLRRRLAVRVWDTLLLLGSRSIRLRGYGAGGNGWNGGNLLL